MAMPKSKIKQRRQELENFVNSSDYQQAVTLLRDSLRQHLMSALGGDWEKAHYEYGLYTITCRIKSTKRILEKFDRLTKEGKDISLHNFHQFMPDLVGGRLIAVDPSDIFTLASLVENGCNCPIFSEPGNNFKKLRVRHGKFSMYNPKPFEEKGYNIDVEDSGYCSVHFVYSVGEKYFERFCDLDRVVSINRLNDDGRILRNEWRVEIQIRTIMDEAWGEVDHFIRYEDAQLRDDPNMKIHFAALAGFLQAANHHIQLIREAARMQKDAND
jgi:putative GTP pyrophosphokinase